MSKETEVNQFDRPPLKLTGEPELDGAEVLYNTLTSKGGSFAEWAYGRLEQYGIVAMVFSGESGGAKTTLASQFTREIIRMTKGEVFLTVISSGQTVNSIERNVTDYLRKGKRYKPSPHPLHKKVEKSIIEAVNADFKGILPQLDSMEEFDRGQFGANLWASSAEVFSLTLQESIEKSLKPTIFTGRRDLPSLIIADVAGIGINSRVAANLDEIAAKYKQHVLFAVDPANPEIQGKALELRNKSTRLLSEILIARGVKPVREQEIPINSVTLKRIKCLTAKEEQKVKKELEAAKLNTDMDPLDALIAIREGARPGRFELTRDIYYKEAIQWARDNIGDFERRRRPISNLFKEYSITSKGYEDSYCLKLAYAEHYMENMLGLSPDSENSRLIVVPYIPTTIHQYRGLLEKQDF